MQTKGALHQGKVIRAKRWNNAVLLQRPRLASTSVLGWTSFSLIQRIPCVHSYRTSVSILGSAWSDDVITIQRAPNSHFLANPLLKLYQRTTIVSWTAHQTFTHLRSSCWTVSDIYSIGGTWRRTFDKQCHQYPERLENFNSKLPQTKLRQHQQILYE